MLHGVADGMLEGFEGEGRPHYAGLGHGSVVHNVTS